ncbi:MAG: DUF1573 domain-containing protein [Flavobacteriales bacterium]|nr:DUF1573 domain-containing protein [Flavobacteriales bacterium]
MKQFLFTLGLSLFTLGAMAQPGMKPVGGTGPMLSLDKEVHDYGNIKQGGNGECEFTVTNTGDQPLIISQCQGSCGCTVPQCDTAPIKPGAKSVIKVKYDSNRPGSIAKSVTITSNATNAPSKVIQIKGFVESAPTTPTSPEKEPAQGAPVEKK